MLFLLRTLTVGLLLVLFVMGARQLLSDWPREQLPGLLLVTVSVTAAALVLGQARRDKLLGQVFDELRERGNPD